jgi:hypothetical protein
LIPNDKQIYVLVFALVMVAFIAFVAGKGCAPTPIDTLPTQGIDAGPGESQIAQSLDASIQQGNEQLVAIEHKFDEDMAAFSDAQRAEYERLRQGDVDATARYLLDWNRRRQQIANDL